ncbi:UNVERIFIED_CONTAM: hypothetical protein FKN15_018404 [Acipenser sinensis]
MSLYSFGLDPVSCHAWNKDRTQIAISPNTTEVHIYQKSGKEWTKIHELTQHSGRITGYIKDIEEKPGPTAWGSKMPFGEMLLEQGDDGGWVHSVCFSPSGNSLAWVSHRSTICVTDAANKKIVIQLKTEYLPLLAVLYLNETEIVAAERLAFLYSLVGNTAWLTADYKALLMCFPQGHDCCPYQFSYTGPGSLKYIGKIDLPKQNSKVSMSAMQHFRNLDKRATTENENTDLETLH